jgi:hypothetical protein
VPSKSNSAAFMRSWESRLCGVCAVHAGVRFGYGRE